MTTLFLLANLFLLPTATAEKAKILTPTDKQLEVIFSERKKAYIEFASKQVPTSRKPASSEETEKEILLKDFESESLQIFETLFIDKSGGKKKTQDYFQTIAKAFLVKANDKESKVYKALRISALSIIDGRNPEGGISFPIKKDAVKVVGVIGHNVDIKERCIYNEEKQTEETCTQGWEQDQVLVGVAGTRCHNAGCDSDMRMFTVTVESIGEVTKGRIRYGENVSAEDSKVIRKSVVKVYVEAPIKVSGITKADYK
jgi:hypothetical protein